MSNKRKKKKEDPDNPDSWDIVPDSQELEDVYSTDFDIDDGGEESLSQDLFAMTVTEAPKRKKTRTKKVTAKSKKTQTRTGKPQRKKSPGTIKEKEFKKGKAYISVVCRLETICLDSRLCDEIRRSAHAMKQIQLEANKTFFDHCCAGVSTTNKTHHIAQKNPDLWESIKIYQSQRERAGLSEVTHLIGYGDLKYELREQMVVNAGVMIREHFRTRLRLYVDITFGGLGDTLTKKQKKEKADLVKAIMHACYSVDETDVMEALQMRDILTPDGVGWSEQWIPWPDRIKENGMAFYVRLLWEFQDVVEKRMEAVPNEKGVQAFSLFPVSTNYSRAHIKINGTTLAGFYSRIQQRVPEYRWDLPSVSLSVRSFKENRWTVMRRAFDIAQFETRLSECPLSKAEFAQLSVEEKYEHASHLFANQVTTDGYSASVLMYRPMTEEEKADKESEKKYEEKADKGPVVPPGYVPNVMIGLDPGMRAICTAVCEDFRPESQGDRPPRRRGRRQPRRSHRRRRSTRKKKSDRPHWIKRPKAPRHRNGRDIVSVTTLEYRHLAGFNRCRVWNEGQKKRHPEYQAIITKMPSFKTASYETYLERLEYFWRHVRFLMQFCVDRPFLKWKFFRKRMARVAVDEIARRIVPTVSRQTCVAYGNWSRHKGIKGHAPSPVKGLKEALRKRATVVSMDEFRTSKLCSQCHQPLSSVSYSVNTMLPKRKKRKGMVLARNRAEIEFEEKECYAVLRCDHKDCEARYWDRDVNAAINMLELLKSEVLGLGRMEAFQRP